MNPIIEKLELQFRALKAGTVSSHDFVNEVMGNMPALRGKALPLLNDFLAWAGLNNSDHRRNEALANVMLSQLANWRGCYIRANFYRSTELTALTGADVTSVLISTEVRN